MCLFEYSKQTCFSFPNHVYFVVSNVYGNKLNGSIPAGFQKLESLTFLWVVAFAAVSLQKVTQQYSVNPFYESWTLTSTKIFQQPFFKQFPRSNPFWTWSRRQLGYSVRIPYLCLLPSAMNFLSYVVVSLLLYSDAHLFFQFDTGIFPTMNSPDQFLLPLVILSIFLNCMRISLL
jgi:hypothetical protein